MPEDDVSARSDPIWMRVHRWWATYPSLQLFVLERFGFDSSGGVG